MDMSIKGVFAVFGFPDEEDPERLKLEAELEDYKESPHFKLGMFHKLIMNGHLFSKQVTKFFAKADPSLDVKGIDQAGEYMMFTRAWFWIEQVKIRSKVWKDALKQYANEEFLISIRLSISYFESTEEYEKCAHLKKIQDFVEKNLAS
jgi:hypothetical protein